MKKLKNDRPEKDRFSLVMVRPTKKFIWEYVTYNAGEKITIPSISVNTSIHKIIKEL